VKTKPTQPPGPETIGIGAAVLYCETFRRGFSKGELLRAIRDKRLRWVKVKSGLQLDWAQLQAFASTLE
jgi:hypothetical protein